MPLNNAEKEKAEKNVVKIALSEIKEVESGRKPVDQKYYEAIELLERKSNYQKNDSDSYQGKSPRMSRKIRAAIFEADQFERRLFGEYVGTKNAARLIRINRILSSYGKGEAWEENLSIAGILSRARNYQPFFSKELCKKSFGLMVEICVFETPEFPDLLRIDGDPKWKTTTADFLVKMVHKNESIPVKLIFVAFCIDDLKVLSWNPKKIREEQICFFDQMSARLSEIPNYHLSAILGEFQERLKKVKELFSTTTVSDDSSKTIQL